MNFEVRFIRSNENMKKAQNLTEFSSIRSPSHLSSISTCFSDRIKLTDSIRILLSKDTYTLTHY